MPATLPYHNKNVGLQVVPSYRDANTETDFKPNTRNFKTQVNMMAESGNAIDFGSQFDSDLKPTVKDFLSQFKATPTTL